MTLTALTFAVLIAPAPLETVKLKLTVGDKLAYKSVTQSESDGMGELMKVTMTSVEAFEVLGESEGWFKLKSVVQEFDVNMEGGAMHEAPDFSQKGLTVSYEVDGTRKMRKFKIESPGQMSDTTFIQHTSSKDAAMQELSLPDKDLAVGTTWERKGDLPSFTSSEGESTSTGEIKLTYKVAGFEGEGKDRAVVIEGTRKGEYSISFGGGDMTGKVSGTMKYWVRASDGVLLKMETSSEDKMSSAFGDFGSKQKRTLELVKPK